MSLLGSTDGQVGVRAAWDPGGCTHQADAVGHVLAGRNVVVVTPTASGKTLCYNLPAVDAILKDPSARALYLFPTKALAQDQQAELHGLVEAIGADVKTYTYDGDTPSTARRAIRQAGPHRRDQPGHAPHWHSAPPRQVGPTVREPALRRRGRAAPLPRGVRQPRRQRSAAARRSAPSTVPTPSSSAARQRSATPSSWAIGCCRMDRLLTAMASWTATTGLSGSASPPLAERAERLVDLPLQLVDDNGAPTGERFLVLYNPPAVNRQLGIRAQLHARRPRPGDNIPGQQSPDDRLCPQPG